ncbi:MAG: GNAT family N-acetyltransferase, partial [Acidimicrobiales bacterium]
MVLRTGDAIPGEAGDENFPPRLPVRVEVVPMRRRHLRSVLAIEEKVYPRPWSLGLFIGELSLRGSRLYSVARMAGEIVGYSGLMVVGDDAHVTTIAVDPAWQRRHVGFRLMWEMAT